MKLWITGSQGLVGRALQQLCKKEAIEFVASSHDQVDISSLKHIKDFLHTEGKEVTHIVNCAAYTHVDQAEKEPELAHQVNAIGSENIGTAAHQFDLKVLHLSTDYVFGTDSGRPFTETDACNPESVYAKTKYEGEQRLMDAFPQACILRTSWVFGPGGKTFVSSILDKIQREEKIYVVSDQKNRLTYVNDLAQAILSLLCHSGIFHFANQGETSRFDVAQQMLSHAKGRGLPVVCQEVFAIDSASIFQLAKRPLYSVLDTTKIENLLGISPRPWEITLKDYIYEHEPIRKV